MRFIHILNVEGSSLSYIKSLFSTPCMERKAKISDIIVNMTGNIALFAKVRSPMFACVSIISKNEDMIVAFDDFIADKQGDKAHSHYNDCFQD